jgi:D-glycero-alpha-D-manno-heptose-7-phosphate kinase
MIISKTPFRVSFFGGGTDYPDYFNEFGGSVISTSINHYMYITVKAIVGVSDFKYRIAYSKLEICNNVDEIQHPVVNAVIKMLDIQHGLEINIISDLPAKTGIGSSSSFTVGLLNALHTLKGETLTQKELALEAIYVEQTLLKERVGVQDQLAAACGGLNKMVFTKESLQVMPIALPQNRLDNLQENLLMFYTGLSRFASVILEEQIKNTQEQKVNVELGEIHAMVEKGIAILQSETEDLNNFGHLLNQGWLTKKKLSSAISNSFLDEVYNKAIAAGALGGKLLGAGGGGFYIFYAPKDNHLAIRNALQDLKEVHFNFENEGSSIIYKN